ncbi:MAG: UDP-glucose 4-epimerase GalE [Arenicella sp.]|nr:UDP-glucose 4-epimerase GalE [Arenicella sp.]
MQQFSNKILVTGGAGYIGSHTVVSLIEQGFEVVVLDNFSNSCAESLRRVERITGVKLNVVRADVRDQQALQHTFEQNKFDAVIHFAGLKAVGESAQQPLRYYQNNVDGALQLLKVMNDYECKRIVFSSSATVYGDPSSVPITESFPLSATNPYGQSKLMVENILRDLSSSDLDWQISILRYFNPVGAHQSGLIGEDPSGVPNNLLPYISQVGVGKLECLSVYGDDYDTHDGTGVRDYIHVVDLAIAHIKALQALNTEHGCQSYNIGTGRGYSVLEMVKAFERVSGQNIKYKIVPRRLGDVASCYADTDKSARTLGWRAEHDLDDMMRDHWHWQHENPNGYN